MLGTAAIRKQFPHIHKRTYFNVASNGPMPNRAYNILAGRIEEARNAAIGAQEGVFNSLNTISANGAKLFGCKKTEVGFAFNTTFGINLAAFGLPLQKGDEVILSDVEFPANVYPWLELKNRGVKVTLLKNSNGCFDINTFIDAITKKTKVLSLSFVQFHNGFKNDLKTLGDICRNNDIYFVVDAIQGAGVEPLLLNKWGVDIAAAGAQKWLLSPQGTGLFYISEKIQEIIQPPWRSWLSIDWKCDWSNLNDYTKEYPKTARQFEMGTYPVPIMLAMDDSLKFIAGLGVKKIQEHNRVLLDRLIAYLKSNPFYKITSNIKKKHRSGILSFTTKKGDIRALFNRLNKKRVLTALREGSIRVSVHVYNNGSEIDKLIRSLDKFSSDS